MGDLTRTSVVPDLMAALIDTARENLVDLDIDVYDGFGIGENPGDCLMVGVDDPNETTGLARSADSQQSWANAGARSRDEEGDIHCASWAWVGGVDNDAQRAVRERVYEIASRVAELCRSNPAFDVDGVLWTGFGTRADLTEGNTDQGVIALLLFDIHFRARI